MPGLLSWILHVKAVGSGQVTQLSASQLPLGKAGARLLREQAPKAPGFGEASSTCLLPLFYHTAGCLLSLVPTKVPAVALKKGADGWTQTHTDLHVLLASSSQTSHRLTHAIPSLPGVQTKE